MTDETFWTGVYSIGVAQGVFLAAALLVKRGGNRRAARVLAALVLVFASMIALELVEGSLTERARTLAMYLGINVELAIGPLLLLFVRAIVAPESRGRRALVHLVPLAAALLLWGLVWALVADPRRPFGLEIQSVFNAYVAFKAAFLIAYAAAVWRSMARALRDPQAFVLGRRPVGLRWLQRWLVGLVGVAGVIYLSVFLQAAGVPLALEPDQLGSLLLAGMIYLASTMVLLRPWVFSVRPRLVERDDLSPDVARLEACLARERPWRDPDLTLGDLAGLVGMSENRLSSVLNEGLGTGFYELLSRHRLGEFERLARDPALRDRTVLELALQAGFNSKASFYRVFRQAHGTTPSAFRAAR